MPQVAREGVYIGKILIQGSTFAKKTTSFAERIVYVDA